MEISLSHDGSLRSAGHRRQRGFTLVEVLVSLAVLVLTSVGGMTGFSLLNRYAMDNSDRSAAKALCQERIEQILTLPYRPIQGNASMPVVTSQQDPSISYYLLGNANSDYDLTTGIYTGAANQQTSGTSGEPVIISAQPNSTGTVATPVTGYRFTTVTKAPTTLVTTAGTSVPMVLATVTVTWTIRGTTNSYSLYTLRSPD